MTTKAQLKLGFDTKRLQLFAEINAENLRYYGDDPGKYLGAARLRMSGYQADAVITDYFLHELEFIEGWRRLQSHPELAPVRLLLASGMPREQPIMLVRNPDAAGYLLSVDGSLHESKPCRVDWLKAAISTAIEAAGDSTNLDESEIECAFYRLTSNRQSINQYPIGPAPLRVPEAHDKPFLIRIRHDQGYLELLLGKSARRFQGNEEKVFDDVESRLHFMTSRPESSGYSVVLKNRIRDGLAALSQGFHALNMGFPKSLLAAIEHNTRDHHEQALPRDYLFCHLRNLGNETKLPPHFAGNREQATRQLIESGLATQDRDQAIHLRKDVRFCGTKRWTPQRRQYFRSAVDLVLDQLESSSGRKRDLQSMIVAIDESGAEKIKLYMEQLVGEVATHSSSDPAAVLISAIQWLPLTRVKLVKAKTDPELPNSSFHPAWHKIVLREMIGLDTFKNDPTWIQSKLDLPISRTEIESAVSSLMAAGFIYSDPLRGGRLRQTEKNLMTGDGKSGGSLYDYHRSALQIANQKFEAGDPERQAAWINLTAIHPSEFVSLRKKFTAYLEKVFKEAGSSFIPDQLYLLNTQMFV